MNEGGAVIIYQTFIDFHRTLDPVCIHSLKKTCAMNDDESVLSLSEERPE